MTCLSGIGLAGAGALESSGAAGLRAERVTSVETPEQIAGALRQARIAGEGALVRGRGGSCGGPDPGEGRWVLSVNASGDGSEYTKTLLPRAGADSVVRVPAGATWETVRAGLSARGLDVPILTSNLRSSVGGTLSVGGYGVRSISRGAQIDHVEELTLITPGGETLSCSPSREPEVFRLVLGGLGTLGVISEVALRVSRRPPPVLVHRLELASLSEAMQALVASTASVDPPDMALSFTPVEGALPSRVPVLLGYEGASRPPPLRPAAPPLLVEDFPARLNEDVWRWLLPFGARRKLWADYVVPRSEAVSFCEDVERLLGRRAGVLPHLAGTYLLAHRRGGGDFPLAAHALSQQAREAFGVGLYFMVEEGDRGEESAVLQALSEALRRCIARGGRPYRYGLHDLTPSDERAIYGEALIASYRRQKRRLDPKGTLPSFFRGGRTIGG